MTAAMMPEAIDPDRLSDLLSVMDPDRLGAHVAGLRAEIAALAGPGARALPVPDRPPAEAETGLADDWVGLARRAHSAAGHAQLLGFPGLGGLLNALEAAAKARDPQAAGLALAELRAQHAAGAPRLPPL
ncbi:hypothetical protein P2H44_07085 [Albimonas sp. CAU 1670]|uniref:hypothetical protein n=1 Tax=Albimonas sp. CAU 1670 TaxID=3032599 RepID=UPI0023DBC515|nr:hypothetical protein [Albimonas sp. CAU 1670]MDF2232317.1 hypothetical protein [Albimonas sp. CAU 1670]